MRYPVGGRQVTTWLRCAIMDELMGTAEIAEMLGVSRQRVHQLTRRPGFPEPVAVLSAGSIWERSKIEAWAERSGRAGIDGDEDEPPD
jgi:predicted DNA-binding transcriptional regulator AlpA